MAERPHLRTPLRPFARRRAFDLLGDERKWESEAKGVWTAISRAPFLKALAMFPKGDCWHGGGLWTGDSIYWLNDGYGHIVMRDVRNLRRDLSWHPSENYGGECPGVYYPRLLRDGWTLVGQDRIGKWNDRLVFEKPCSSGWVLRKIAHADTGAPPGKGCYWDEHVLIHPSSDVSIACPDWNGRTWTGSAWSGRLRDDWKRHG